MSFLITRPLYESVTYYFYHWSEEIVKEAKRRIGKIFDIEKEKVSKKLVESYLEKQNPEIVIFNGHGNDVCIAGQNDEPLITSGVNSHLLKDKVVYMRSCDSGKTLGPQAIRDGCKAFIGYAELFQFWTDKTVTGDPLKDTYAKPFFETSNQVALSLIKGRTPKEAQEDSMTKYKEVISHLLISDAENSFIVSDLMWNMRNQVCLEK